MTTAQILCRAIFDGQEITAEFVEGRIQIRGYGCLAHLMQERDAPFWSELGVLQTHTGWKPTWGSLAEDLVAKSDSAHCFIAANLQALGSINRGLALGEQVRIFSTQGIAPELFRLLAKPSDTEARTPLFKELAAALALQGGKG